MLTQSNYKVHILFRLCQAKREKTSNDDDGNDAQKKEQKGEGTMNLRCRPD